MPPPGLPQQPSPVGSCSLRFGWKTSTPTYWVTLNPGLAPQELPMGAHGPLQMASVSIQDICRGELRAGLRPRSAPLLFDSVPQAVLKPLWRVRVLGSLMTKVNSDQMGKPVPFSFQPSAARELGWFEARIATLLVLPGLWKSQPKLSALPLAHSFPFTHSPQARGKDRAISLRHRGKLRYTEARLWWSLPAQGREGVRPLLWGHSP